MSPMSHDKLDVRHYVHGLYQGIFFWKWWLVHHGDLGTTVIRVDQWP